MNQNLTSNLVPRTSRGKKSVAFEHGSANTSNLGPQEKFKVISPRTMCALVTAKLGSRIFCRVQDPELHQLYDASPIIQNVKPGPSLSLRRLLETHRLSNRMKLVLAYIISKSFWQFYDSPWMDAKWTSDCIHFLPESAPNDEAATQDGMLYASKPYLAVDFDAKSREIVEYCDSYAVIYRYPRLLALCIILLEIGRGATLMLQDYGSMEANLNATWTLANRLTDRKQSWGDFDYPDYRRAVANCLDGKLLKQNYRTDAVQPEMDTLTRRTVIYNTIVQPLKKLLERVGFLDTLNTLDPIDSKGPEPAFSIPAAPAFPARSQGDGPSSSRQWLEHFPSINRYIRDLTRSNPAGRPVRITILDTGFDNEAVFFRNPARRQRIKGWKDWVDLSDSPLDDNGHGTHTVALVMKVSPQADIYVARIARDRNSLRDCVESIVEVLIPDLSHLSPRHHN